MSQILKRFYAGDSVYEVLYTNIRIQSDDGYEVQRLKRAIRKAVSRQLKARRYVIELLIRENFDSSAWYCTLTFYEDKLPPDKVKANARFAYFLKVLRKMGYSEIRYIKVLEHKHGDARYHYHTVMSGVPRYAIQKVWRDIYGKDVKISHLDLKRVSGLAKYLAKEVSDAVGRHNYSRSRAPNGLREPERTFEIVDDNYRLSLPPNAELIEQQVLAANAFGQSEFLFFRTPEKCRSARASAKGN